MKKIIPIVALVFSISFFSSCEKEATTTIPTQQLDDVTRYLNAVTTDVLFVSLKINHQSETLTGWLIDKQGNLRVVESNNMITLSDEIIGGDIITALYNNSEVVRAVDKDELVGFHKQAAALSLKRSMGINHNENITSAYISYHLDSKEEDENCSNCTGSNPYAPEGTTFEQKLLIASGHLNQSTVDVAQTINDYLLMFDQELDN